MARKKKSKFTYKERPDGLIPVAIYARVSSVGQDVENSTDAQINECRRWAEKNGYVVVKVYVDKAKTGTADKRPDFQEMVLDTENLNCLFEKVLVWRFSRFFRDYVQSVLYRDRLLKNEVTVISVNEPTDESPFGRLVQHIMDAINAFQSEMIGQDVHSGTHNLAARGFFQGSKAPFGMMKVKVQDGNKERNKLAPDPKTAYIPRRMFDLALQDKTEGKIGHGLRDEGILNPSGKPWKPNRIHDMLTNRHFEGTIVWGENPDGTPETICEGAHEGIVTPEEFARVQDKLKSRAPEVMHPQHAGSEHLLSRLGKCRQCGQPYNYAPAGNAGLNYEYIVCNTRKYHGPEHCDSPRLPASAFEALTLDVIDEDILSLPLLEVALEELRKNSVALQSTNKNLDDIRDRITDFDDRIVQLYFAWENRDIEYEFYSKRNQELRDFRARAQEELERTEAGLDDTSVILNDPDAVLAHSADLKTFLRDETPARARVWIETFLKRYWVEPGWVTYEYSLPLPPGSTDPGLTRRRVALDEPFSPTTRSGPRDRESRVSCVCRLASARGWRFRFGGSYGRISTRRRAWAVISSGACLRASLR